MGAQLLQTAGSVLIHWAALVGTLSVIAHSRVQWWKTTMGVHLMIYMAAMALVLDLSVIRIHFGDSPWFAALRLLVFIAVPIAMTQRLWLQIKAQRTEHSQGDLTTRPTEPPS